MAFSLASCCCRISAESKAFQLQRQLDTIKSEKLRVENGVYVCVRREVGGGLHVRGASSLFSFPERDELKHRTEELGAQMQELFQKVCGCVC